MTYQFYYELKFLLFSLWYYTIMPIENLLSETKKKENKMSYKKSYKMIIKMYKNIVEKNVVETKYDDRFGPYYIIKDNISVFISNAFYLPTFGICISESLYNSEYKEAVLAHEYGHKIRNDRTSVNIFQILNKEFGADRIAKKLGYGEKLKQLLKKELKENNMSPVSKLIVRMRIFLLAL